MMDKAIFLKSFMETSTNSLFLGTMQGYMHQKFPVSRSYLTFVENYFSFLENPHNQENYSACVAGYWINCWQRGSAKRRRRITSTVFKFCFLRCLFLMGIVILAEGNISFWIKSSRTLLKLPLEYHTFLVQV